MFKTWDLKTLVADCGGQIVAKISLDIFKKNIDTGDLLQVAITEGVAEFQTPSYVQKNYKIGLMWPQILPWQYMKVIKQLQI